MGRAAVAEFKQNTACRHYAASRKSRDMVCRPNPDAHRYVSVSQNFQLTPPDALPSIEIQDCDFIRPAYRSVKTSWRSVMCDIKKPTRQILAHLKILEAAASEFSQPILDRLQLPLSLVRRDPIPVFFFSLCRKLLIFFQSHLSRATLNPG